MCKECYICYEPEILDVTELDFYCTQCTFECCEQCYHRLANYKCPCCRTGNVVDDYTGITEMFQEPDIVPTYDELTALRYLHEQVLYEIESRFFDMFYGWTDYI